MTGFHFSAFPTDPQRPTGEKVVGHMEVTPSLAMRAAVRAAMSPGHHVRRDSNPASPGFVERCLQVLQLRRPNLELAPRVVREVMEHANDAADGMSPEQTIAFLLADRESIAVLENYEEGR